MGSHRRRAGLHRGAPFSAGALGRDCRGRLLHDGRVDFPRAGDLLHAVRAGSPEPAGADRGLDVESRCGVHGPGSAAAHRRGRWVPGESSGPHLRPGRQVDRGIPRHRGRGGSAHCPDAHPGAERQRLRGTVRALDTRGMLGSPDSLSANGAYCTCSRSSWRTTTGSGTIRGAATDSSRLDPASSPAPAFVAASGWADCCATTIARPEYGMSLRTDYGVGQVFGHYDRTVIAGRKVEVHFAVSTLGYSRRFHFWNKPPKFHGPGRPELLGGQPVRGPSQPDRTAAGRPERSLFGGVDLDLGERHPGFAHRNRTCPRADIRRQRRNESGEILEYLSHRPSLPPEGKPFKVSGLRDSPIGPARDLEGPLTVGLVAHVPFSPPSQVLRPCP